MRGGIRLVALSLKLHIRKANSEEGAFIYAPGTGACARKKMEKINFADFSDSEFCAESGVRRAGEKV